MDIVKARTDRGYDTAVSQLGGVLSARITEISRNFWIFLWI